MQRISLLKDAEGIPRELFEIANKLTIPIVRTDRQRLDALSQGRPHQGVVAQLGTRSMLTFEDWMQKLLLDKASLVLALDQVQDPQNLGALLRSAEGAGCKHVLLSSERSCGLTPAVSKVSAGADQHLEVGRTAKMGVCLGALKEAGFQIVATSPQAESVYYEVDFCSPTVLLLGGEERGLPPHLRRVASAIVRLPMLGSIESLNVASSGTVLIYEAIRQRLVTGFKG